MSTTRRANNEGPLRQERYASDPALQDHLKASTVARKCRLITNPEHREICLYLQHASMQPGGLAATVSDFLKRYSDRLGSRTMRENRTRKSFTANLVRVIREELNCTDSFPLKGEIDSFRELFASSTEVACMKYQAQHLPTEYPAEDFQDWCFAKAEENLEVWLTELCLNPSSSLENPPGWFYELERSLRDYIADRRTDSLAGKIITSIGTQINDALDYAFDEKCMVLINGLARMGKTYQAQQWCQARPGRVRYVQVPSGNDDISFFRAIARALGTACGSAMNTTQIKRQVEDAIQDSGIMLVFDEAHYLWPQYKDARNSPRRINWLLTEIVNKRIPVALITTPQFDFLQKTIVDSSGWASEQLDGRISYRLDLPTVLPKDDLRAIVSFNLPAAEKSAIDGICVYAESSCKFIAGIEAVSKRARFLAKKAGRTTPDKTDLKTAMLEVDPSLAQQAAKPVEEEPVCNPTAKVRKRACNRIAQPVHARDPELVGAN